jgi:putative ABC transport system permease protein
MEAVAASIDEVFRHDQEPTATFPEKAFTARAVADAMAIVGFTRWLSYGCLFAVLALVGNAIVLSVQDRVRDHAVLQTLGYRGGLIARMVLTEGVILGLSGGLVGSVGAWALSYWGRFSLSTEGLSLSMDTSPMMIATGLLVAIALGALAGLVPAWRASRREIAACFRAV